MRPRVPVVLLALLALTAAVAAGCGSSSSASSSGDAPSPTAFREAFKAQRASLESIGDDVATAVEQAPSQSDAALATQFGALADRADAARDGLGALAPPAKAKAALDGLRSAVADGARHLRAIAVAAHDADAQAAEAATRLLVGVSPRITSGISAVARAAGLPASTTSTHTATGDGRITVSYARPTDGTERLARQILQVGGTDGVAAGFTKSFVLPADVSIKVVNGFVAPNYEPSTRTITLSYGFVDYIAAVLRKGLPDISEHDLGEQLASIDGFILVHELGHAFVDLFELPITGREEDAVDQLATVFLVDAVKGGDGYAFNAARFFKLLSENRAALRQSDYWNEHSLDQQRAYDIVCTVAGSSQASYRAIARLGILGKDRLRRCPAEYQQKTTAWKALLEPHTRG